MKCVVLIIFLFAIPAAAQDVDKIVYQSQHGSWGVRCVFAQANTKVCGVMSEVAGPNALTMKLAAQNFNAMARRDVLSIALIQPVAEWKYGVRIAVDGETPIPNDCNTAFPDQCQILYVPMETFAKWANGRALVITMYDASHHPHAFSFNLNGFSAALADLQNAMRKYL